MRFQHTCHITRDSPDPRTRDAFDVPTGAKPTPVAIYQGRCQVSEDQTRIRRLESGDSVAGRLDALIRLASYPTQAINPETDHISATYHGGVRSGRIIGVERLSRYPRLLVHWHGTH